MFFAKQSIACALFMIAPVTALAQAAPTATIPEPTFAPTSAVLRVGTEVPLKLSEPLSTKHEAVRVGQRFRMAVSEDVKVDGVIVIPVGSPAMGEVTDVRNKGMWGKSGHLSAQILYVQVNGRQIRLSGTFDEKGTTGTAGVVTAIVLVPIAGFFTTGTSAQIPAGANVKGFVDEDIPLAFTAQPAAPMVVAPPPAPMAVAVPSAARAK